MTTCRDTDSQRCVSRTVMSLLPPPLMKRVVGGG